MYAVEAAFPFDGRQAFVAATNLPQAEVYTMTEGHLSAASTPRALDAVDLLFMAQELADAVRRLGAVGRMLHTERKRLFHNRSADRDEILKTWSTCTEMNDLVVSVVEATAKKVRDAMLNAGRQIDDLPARPPKDS